MSREPASNMPADNGKPQPAGAATSPGSPRYRLRLYVSGATLRSTRAIVNIKAIGDSHLAGHYDLEVIDAYQQPELARAEQIAVLPTLIKVLPGPLRRLVGDLADENHVLRGLGLGGGDASPSEATGDA